VTVVFTQGARADLDDILAYTQRYFPRQLTELEQRFGAVIARIERHPKSAPALLQHRDVRIVPLVRFPFKILFREIPNGVEILHVHHSARNVPLS